MLQRRCLLLILTALATLLLAGTGVANADPPPGQDAAAGALPAGFPSELRRFVSGTTEFKSGPWFTGVCKDRGGDIGAYIDAIFPVEDRLIYWAMSSDQKKAVLRLGMFRAAGPNNDGPGLDAVVDSGREPPKALLPTVFPSGNGNYRMPQPACADDVKRWASKDWNTWGFVWAAAPDRQSLAQMRATPGFGDVPDKAWTAPCDASLDGNYCAHAFFVNCDTGDAPSGDQARCAAWNVAVARLFVGTAHWIEADKSFADRIDDFVHASGVYAVGSAFVTAFGWFFGAATEYVKFVANPQSVIDDWANSSKASAVDLSAKVLHGLSAVGSFDPSQPWFLQWYAYSTGLGVAVMGLMTLLALWRAAAKGETAKTIAADLAGYLPAGIVCMLFAPLFAQLLVSAASSLSDCVTRIAGPDMADMLANLQRFTGSLTAPGLPGGAIVGLILFLLLIAGCLAVFFGLLMHAVALPALAVASGIGFGMWVHPKWRSKALRPVLVFIALIASKPLLFLLLAVETSVINAALTGQPTGQGTLARTCLVVVAFIVVGLAPWSLLRYAPLLPTRSDAAGFGGHSPSLLAGAVGGLGSAQLWRHPPLPARGQGERPGTDRERGKHDNGEDPRWRTAGRGDGRSRTEARLGDTLAARGNATPQTGRVGARGPSGQGAGAVRAGGAGRATSAAAAGVPIAAAGAAGVLAKARAVAEAAPGEAED